MPHVNPDLPNNGENADAEDISVPFLALLAIFNGHIGPDNIEPGSMPWSIMGNFTDSIPASAMRDSANLELFRRDVLSNFVAEGCIWSSLTGLDGAMTEGVVYIGGVRMSINAVTNYTFTASKDTYVSISSTGSVGYTPVNNGAAAPALGTNSMWIAIVVTNATTITSVIQNNAVDSNGETVYQSGPIAASAQGDTGWITPTFTANYSASSTVQYRKIGPIVYFRGQAIRATGSPTIGDEVFTLPFGYRPGNSTNPIAAIGVGTSVSKIDVRGDTGKVNISATVAAGNYVAFNGICVVIG